MAVRLLAAVLVGPLLPPKLLIMVVARMSASIPVALGKVDSFELDIDNERCRSSILSKPIRLRSLWVSPKLDERLCSSPLPPGRRLLCVAPLRSTPPGGYSDERRSWPGSFELVGAPGGRREPSLAALPRIVPGSLPPLIVPERRRRTWSDSMRLVRGDNLVRATGSVQSP